MNRQRRLEAIARTRAFVESQMLMLNTKESKVPNIIRSRRSIVQSGKPRVPNFQAVEHVSSEVSSADNEQVYLTIVDGSEVGFTLGEGVEGNVPVVISEEICKVLENGDQCLQTIRTEDGTIMVVIEGGEESGVEEVQGPVPVASSVAEKVKSCVKRKVVKKKPVKVCTEVVKKLKVESIVRDNEKPRPFRFELEEDDEVGGGFMSVPVPIAIGSLKSQTGKLDTREFEQLDKLLPPTTHTPEQNLVIKSTNSLQTQELTSETTTKQDAEPDQAPVTIQSARTDRPVNESNESLGFSFRNLFEQVTSNIVFN